MPILPNLCLARCPYGGRLCWSGAHIADNSLWSKTLLGWVPSVGCTLTLLGQVPIRQSLFGQVSVSNRNPASVGRTLTKSVSSHCELMIPHTMFSGAKLSRCSPAVKVR